MRKRLASGLFAVLLAFLAIFSGFVPKIQVEAAGKTLIIHYGEREDGNYDGWNLWIWEEGKDGQEVKFTEEDAYGPVAIYQTNGNPGNIGYIVRLNNWEAKDVEDDRFVSMNQDVVEIWVKSGEAEPFLEAPQGAEKFDFEALEEARLAVYDEADAYKLNVHFYTFDEQYHQENLVAYAWPGKEIGSNYPMVEKDDFGAVFHVGLKPDADTTTAGVNIIHDGAIVGGCTYEVDLTKAKDQVLDLYVVDGNAECWYDKKEAVFDPVIATAAFKETSSALIDFTVSKPIEEEDFSKISVTDMTGKTYEIAEVAAKKKTLSLKMEEPLALSNTYQVNMEGYVSAQVSMGQILGSDFFDSQLAYDGDDLGATYSKEKTVFKLWAPMASEVTLNMFSEGTGDAGKKTTEMKPLERGVWTAEVSGDLNGIYYTYTIKNGLKTTEAVDLYARAVGVNGDRGMVVDLDSTDPEGFDQDVRPAFANPTDAVIYEVHVRDFSIDPSSGIENKGKFLGFTEKGTKNSQGIATGLDHLLDMGITHIQLQPSYDYATVDESKTDSTQFNWGYDPKNYNVPEGSYSSDPFHGEVRVKEMKQMIQTLHENGIRVNMDVVYNHTFNAEESWFQKTVPDYYYRKAGEKYGNGSGCGNETASERAMVRKYIVDSVVYWATEYHVDGFRFDLMALHDTETMNAVREALNEIDPTIMVYGEGWTGGESLLHSGKQSSKKNLAKIQGVGAFSDDIRDGIKGNVFDSFDTGFVSGKEDMEESIKFGVVGSTYHLGVMMYKNSKGSDIWAKTPSQSINYISCHDNLTFWDKLAISNPEDSVSDRVKMTKLGNAIIMTCQGVPFMLAGEEMLRSKPSATTEGAFDENSYCSPDSTNSMKWDSLGASNTENEQYTLSTYEYYKGMIAFRKAHSALRMTDSNEVQEKIVFSKDLETNVVAYEIKDHANGDSAENIFVVYNANKTATTVKLPAGEWDICVNADSAGNVSLGKASGEVSVDAVSALVLVQGDETLSLKQNVENVENTEVSNASENKTGIIVTVVAIILCIGGGVYFIWRRKK